VGPATRVAHAAEAELARAVAIQHTGEVKVFARRAIPGPARGCTRPGRTGPAGTCPGAGARQAHTRQTSQRGSDRPLTLGRAAQARHDQSDSTRGAGSNHHAVARRTGGFGARMGGASARRADGPAGLSRCARPPGRRRKPSTASRRRPGAPALRRRTRPCTPRSVG
jgi:hypothetical protein